MADTLIETIASNPYDGIIADTATKISDIDAQMQLVTNAITKLEQQSPTSPTLPQLRERLASLQSQRQSLSDANDSAKTLSNSFIESLNTMQGVYALKQNELSNAQKQAANEYNNMVEDTKRVGQNYINALGNATSSENSIINANAGRQGASSQSTAEARARNYLNNAQAQNEAANNTLQNVNAIREGKINTNAGYVQLSQSNADNTLRQDVMNQFQAAENQKDRDLQKDLTKMQVSAYKSSSNTTFDPSKFTKEQRESINKYLKEHADEDEDEDEDK